MADRQRVTIVPGNLTGSQAIAVHCDSCNWRGRDKDPGSGEVDAGVVRCPGCGRGRVDYTYQPGVRCGGCGTVDYTLPLSDEHGSYCRRVCQLQAEHARSLEKEKT